MISGNDEWVDLSCHFFHAVTPPFFFNFHPGIQNQFEYSWCVNASFALCGFIITSDASEICKSPHHGWGWSCPIWWWFQAPPRWLLAAIPLIGYCDIRCNHQILQAELGEVSFPATFCFSNTNPEDFGPNIHMPKRFDAPNSFQNSKHVPDFSRFFHLQHISRFLYLSPRFFSTSSPNGFRGLGVGAAEGRGPGDRAAADLGLRGTGERADGRTRPPRGSGKGWMEGGLASGNFT